VRRSGRVVVGLDGGTAGKVAQGAGGPWAIAVDETAVYWISDSVTGWEVLKTGLDGGPPVLLAKGPGYISGRRLAVCAKRIFWTVENRLLKVAK
jgi:hypothetical protein